MPYVYSKCSAHVDFAIYEKTPGGLDRIVKVITIKGRANVANNDPHKGIFTPQGIVNKVSKDELDLLNKHPVFQAQVRDGFITVENKEAPVEKVVKDMEAKDKSAQITPDDYKNTKGAKPITRAV